MLCSTWCLAASIGPVVGGSLAAHGQWRWLFCECCGSCVEYLGSSADIKDLNLPVSLLACVSVLFLSDLPTPPGSYREKIMRMDWMYV